jgi:hypothetical protein
MKHHTPRPRPPPPHVARPLLFQTVTEWSHCLYKAFFVMDSDLRRNVRGQGWGPGCTGGGRLSAGRDPTHAPRDLELPRACSPLPCVWRCVYPWMFAPAPCAWTASCDRPVCARRPPWLPLGARLWCASSPRSTSLSPTQETLGERGCPGFRGPSGSTDTLCRVVRLYHPRLRTTLALTETLTQPPHWQAPHHPLAMRRAWQMHPVSGWPRGAHVPRPQAGAHLRDEADRGGRWHGAPGAH